MDITLLNGVPSHGSGNSFRDYPNPGHGPYRGAINDTFENIVYVDGHLEGINDPFNTRPQRNASLKLHF